MKLEVKDLRVWNLLQKDDGSIYSVRRLTIRDEDILVNEQPSLLTLNYNLQPIPITEEWLLRFGFKRFGKDFSLKGIIIHTRKRGYVLRKSVPIIKYVHQLMNLFYALTGEELQLNQTT